MIPLCRKWLIVELFNKFGNCFEIYVSLCYLINKSVIMKSTKLLNLAAVSVIFLNIPGKKFYFLIFLKEMKVK